MSCKNISQLPTDILLDNILGQLDALSLVQFSSTSRQFAQLGDDELVWKHLVMRDFHIPLDASFRQMGWKNLYQRLSDSRVYTWGENIDHRLGLDDSGSGSRTIGVHRFFNSVSVANPQEITFLRGKNIIDIAAGGWSFHALDRHGDVWMWGILDKEAHWRHRSRGSDLVRQPTRVNLPDGVKIASISCGRSHVIALDRDGNVWHWKNIWQPQRVRLSPSTINKNTDYTIIQVTANWSQSSILTNHGEVIIVPLPVTATTTRAGGEQGEGELISEDLVLDETSIKKVSLPSIAQNDQLYRSSSSSSSATKLPRPILEGDTIVQIAGMESETLALSRFGRIYKIDTSVADTLAFSPCQHTIEYIHFGAKENQNENNERSKLSRFISATFRTFAVYTLDGQVLIGKQDHSFDEYPKKLENQGICKMSFGDYHYGALTNQGSLLTWGAFSAGALGHGEVPEGEESVELDYPKEVEALKDMYVFAIGFGGWHSSVLAIPRN